MEKIEKEIMKVETEQVINNLKSGKMPGMDSYTGEFLKKRFIGKIEGIV